MVTTESLLATAVAAILFASGVSGRGVVLSRAYCTNAKQVVEGNTCENIADKRCTISLAQFKSYNPNLDCSNLRVGQNFCCNEGTVPRDADCTNHKTVVEGNTCASIADKRCTISLSKFTSLNPHLDCSELKVGQAFCCNEGAVPLPDCTNIKTVLEGNTCAIIADKRCAISLSKFQDYNPHVDCSNLEIGTKVCCMEGKVPQPEPNNDGTCVDRQVTAGDTCGTLHEKCGITPSQLTTYNPASNFCASLKVNQWICCSPGKLRDRRPKNNPDGSCATYTVKPNDSCSVIEAANGMSEGELDTYNKKKTWGWAGCDKLWPDFKICLSSGTPPMPLPVANSVCGPQKPGTIAPPRGTNISTLNPCPLNTCCNVWGQCGTTKEFCEITGDGTPGTGTCVSNCGMEIVNNNVPPAEYRRIGYFEAWNVDRDCLWMDASSIDENQFTHIHFAFADVTPDFRVDVSKVQAQFDKFKALKKSKRIVAFGGWAASTSTTTFQIFREGVNPANRATLATNIANFVRQHGLDGADIDWEYPAAPDLPDIPPADPIDGPNYLAFLRLLRAALPADKTLSIAAPASFWYLKGFPIKDMGNVLDYIVYMTYDLHGQWDAGSKWSQDGCPNGMCLRSHINMTETYNALVMVTKAGVPSNKIIVGVSSYGRAFKMKNPNCRGPMCEYTGTASVSNALPGPCTGTQGYISNAEINEFLDVDDFGAESYYDAATRSNIAIINGTWVAYMDAAEKGARSTMYKNWNFGGTSDWAHDLESFTDLERKTSGHILTSRFTRKGVSDEDSARWYDLECSMEEVYMADMDKKERWEGLKADEAWADAVKAYTTRKRDTGSFTSWVIGTFFLGKQGVDCGTMLSAGPCLSEQGACYDRNTKPRNLTADPPIRTGPAGLFITDSMVKIEQAFVNYYNALEGARSEVSDLAPVLEDYFMQEVDNTFAKQLGYNILAMFTGLITGPLVGLAFKNSWAEDAGQAAVLMIVATFKDKNTGDLDEELSKASDLALAMNATMTQWENAVTRFAAQLFSGKDDGNALLAMFMAEGALISGGVPIGTELQKSRIMNAGEMKGMAKRALFTYMIPVAWMNNKDANVAILETENACGDFTGLTKQENVPRQELAELVEFCWDNKQYLLLAAIGPYEKCEHNGGPWPFCTHNLWSLPPGLDKLPDFGVTHSEIMEGAIKTWIKNGKENGGEFNADDLTIADYYDPLDPGRNKVIDMGLIKIPVCKIADANYRWGRKEGDFYPC